MSPPPLPQGEEPTTSEPPPYPKVVYPHFYPPSKFGAPLHPITANSKYRTVPPPQAH